ncbi:HMG domain-containing protein [Hamiltosporidium magnivora]|uniref:HMG domain-containing protein n=1 Tax=Hamiltosporidium magnivora TaxID=148818 RepID=A0A4Q9L1Z8_9MICR|nr:HMG domain-containing protein [Hamiltosporidium magnivora]
MVKKSLKDPNAPKRPGSAYLIYCTKQRELMASELENVPVKDQLKRFGEMWASLDPKEKEIYNAKYEKRSKEFKEAWKEYTLTPGYKEFEQKSKQTTTSKKKKKGTRAISAYNEFTAEQYSMIKSQNPGSKFGSLASTVSAKWKNMSDEEKMVYQKRADERQKRKEQENVKNDE